jgi:hypothetical protein
LEFFPMGQVFLTAHLLDLIMGHVCLGF